jgi:hypothetical protein
MMDHIIPKYVTLVIMMDHIIPKYVKHPGNAFFAKKKAPVAGSNGGTTTYNVNKLIESPR